MVTISATNGAGNSNTSNVVTGRTAEAGNVCGSIQFDLKLLIVPGIVKIYNTTSLPDGTSTAVVWYQPKQPNGIIIGYQVIYSVYNDSTMIMGSVLLTSTSRKHTIKNLSK